MKQIVRLLIVVSGVMALILAALAWVDPVQLAARLGIAAQSPLGSASLRADLGGFFGAWGLLSLVAAGRCDRQWLIAPILLVGLALAGRIASLAIDGMAPGVVPPMLVEVTSLAVLLLGWFSFPRAARA